MTTTASQTDLHTLAHRFIDDVINARDFDGAMVDMVAEDFVELKPFPGQGPGRGARRCPENVDHRLPRSALDSA